MAGAAPPGFNWQRTFGSRGVGLSGTHSEAKVGQQVKDLVAQGVPPEVVIARSPVVGLEDSREPVSTAQRRGMYDLARVNAGRASDDGRVDRHHAPPSVEP